MMHFTKLLTFFICCSHLIFYKQGHDCIGLNFHSNINITYLKCKQGGYGARVQAKLWLSWQGAGVRLQDEVKVASRGKGASPQAKLMWGLFYIFIFIRGEPLLRHERINFNVYKCVHACSSVNG